MIFVFFLPSDESVVVYSQERMAKKRAPVRRSPIAWVRGDEVSERIARQTERGKQAWLFRGASLFEYALSNFL